MPKHSPRSGLVNYMRAANAVEELIIRGYEKSENFGNETIRRFYGDRSEVVS